LVPSVAMDVQGNFVVAWEHSNGRAVEIRARRFAASGLPQGDEFTVDKATAGMQFSPTVACNPAGYFVIAWHRPVGGTSKIWGRAFAPNGTPQGPAIAISTSLFGAHKGAQAALGAAGDLVVTWHSNAGESWDVFAQTKRLKLEPVRRLWRAAKGASSNASGAVDRK